MKTLKRVLFFLAGICLLIACTKSDHFWGDDPLGNTLKGGKAEPVMVTVPFDATFVGVYDWQAIGPDESCGYDETSNPYMYRVIVNAEGSGIHLGNCQVYFSFCCNFLSGEYGLHLGPGEEYITTANGDKIFVQGSGTVVEGRLPDHPLYVASYWRDPFVITGGTGRFEGATGGGMMDDYNSSEDPYSHHHWTGTITMVKGKQ